jgi:hypothetical protein
MHMSQPAPIRSGVKQRLCQSARQIENIRHGARLAFCSAIFFSLETFPDFPIFFGNRKEVLEALMTMGELFAVAILSSVIFALAAHWQNDSDGGMT